MHMLVHSAGHCIRIQLLSWCVWSVEKNLLLINVLPFSETKQKCAVCVLLYTVHRGVALFLQVSEGDFVVAEQEDLLQMLQ